MRDRALRYRCVKKSKNNTIKVGVRSISDIIANKRMDFKKKLTYIRHHYTYYNGNYDLFATETGTPNARKFKLNALITDVINGVKDASELKEFNKKILEWRKEADEEKEKISNRILTNFDGSSYNNINPENMMQWELDIKHSKTTALEYIKLIEEYLENNPEEKSILRALSYHDMKRKALEWRRENETIKFEEVDLDSLTLGEYFRHNYLTNILDKPSSYLNLVCAYLDSKENIKHTRDMLKTERIDTIKEEAVQWAILKAIDNNKEIFDILETCPHKVRKRIQDRVNFFNSNDEEKRARKLMKKWSEELGYTNDNSEMGDVING